MKTSKCIITILLVSSLSLFAKGAETDDAQIGQSRFLEADKSAYISEVSAKFAMGGREKDPFGLPQDPNKVPVKKAAAPKLAPVKRATPLQDVVNELVINAHMPASKEFMVGARILKEGQVIPMIFGGEKKRVQITEVGRDVIVFTDLESKEKVVRKMNELPDGVNELEGVEGVQSVEGFQRADEANQAPIEVR